MSLRAALDQLDQEIEETEVFSRLHRVRKGRYLFDHALALYLQVALEAADAVRLLAREQHVRRAPLLARFLWETLIDVAYLTTRDAADQDCRYGHFRILTIIFLPGDARGNPQART